MINAFLVKDVSSVASMADALFPEKAELPKVDIVKVSACRYHRFQTMCITNVHTTHMCPSQLCNAMDASQRCDTTMYW